MYRLMQPSDWAEVLALWQAQRGDTEEFVRGAVERFAGVQNVYVAEENDHIEAVALAVPVTLQGRPGSYLFGLCGQGSLLLAGLVDTLCAQQKLRGAGFVVAVPASPEQSTLLQDKGFQKAFALRCLPREVERNLWSQAEFDSVTAKNSASCGQNTGPTPFSCRRSRWGKFCGTCIPVAQPSYPVSRATASISAGRIPFTLWR